MKSSKAKWPTSQCESFDTSSKLKNEISFSNVVVTHAVPILKELVELSKPVDNSENFA